MQDERVEALKAHLGQVMDLQGAAAVLQWDQEVYMPRKGAEARGEQLATLQALAHRLFASDETAELLEALEGDLDALPPRMAKLAEVTRYDYDRALRLPEAFVKEFAIAQCRAYEAWTAARAASDFARFRPHLETMVALLRRRADYMGYEETPYDALLEDHERGMTTAMLRPVFAELGTRQSALVERIMASPRQPDLSWSKTVWPEDAQWRFCMRVLADMGYDLEAGRMDRSVHPFSTSFDVYDVRVTTRLSEREPFMAVMGAIHEGGHALYSQGHDPEDRRTPLLEGASLGIHESQSRMWENMIGRSLPFWRRYAPVLREHFPEIPRDVSAEQVYAAVNAVQPSLIRVEADECTYNLHIILRFEIELDLIEGRLAAADVPEAWNAKVKQYLGIDVPDDAHGCLQDIHWAHGSMGYFPTYALGNLYAAQMMPAIERDMPDLWARVEQGDFGGLLAWLRAHVHRVGRAKTPVEIVRDISGAEPGAEAYLTYLESKYLPLYGLA